MEQVMILNASPRAPRSNSKEYAALFSARCSLPCQYFALKGQPAAHLIQEMEHFSHLLLVFPLYVDSLPVELLAFLEEVQRNPPKNKPRLSVLINCGFLEPGQNDVAVDILRLFAKTVGFPMGSVMKLGSGEAILRTPFRSRAEKAIGQLAAAMEQGKETEIATAMPLPRFLFIRAGNRYWKTYGKENGTSYEEMCRMDIEGR